MWRLFGDSDSIVNSQFGVGPLLYLCCSSHVLPLYIFCPPVVPLMCSCFASLVPLVPPLLFLISSTVHLHFTWGHWEDLKRSFLGTILSLFCSSKPYKTTLILAKQPSSDLTFLLVWNSDLKPIDDQLLLIVVECRFAMKSTSMLLFCSHLYYFQILMYSRSSQRFKTNFTQHLWHWIFHCIRWKFVCFFALKGHSKGHLNFWGSATATMNEYQTNHCRF